MWRTTIPLTVCPLDSKYRVEDRNNILFLEIWLRAATEYLIHASPVGQSLKHTQDG